MGTVGDRAEQRSPWRPWDRGCSGRAFHCCGSAGGGSAWMTTWSSCHSPDTGRDDPSALAAGLTRTLTMTPYPEPLPRHLLLPLFLPPPAPLSPVHPRHPPPNQEETGKVRGTRWTELAKALLGRLGPLSWPLPDQPGGRWWFSLEAEGWVGSVCVRHHGFFFHLFFCAFINSFPAGHCSTSCHPKQWNEGKSEIKGDGNKYSITTL